jgi:pilus assembly protein Flp/PilA
MNSFSKLLRDDGGATAIEYGLIAALVGVALIGALGTLRTSLEGTFTDVGTALDGAGGGGGGGGG